MAENSFLLFSFQEKRERGDGYFFFLLTACLAATAAFFFEAVELALDCFWPDFFWLAFGDLSPMMFLCLLTVVDSPAEWNFPRRHLHHGGWRAGCKCRLRIHLPPPVKDKCRYLLLFPQNLRWWPCLLDGLSLSRHGESSSELVSVMILDPINGNSL